MARIEKAVFTNMCMISDGHGNILVQDRKNPNWPGITFPGGHVEYTECFVDSVIREVKEETGLTIENPVLCGIKQFQTRDDARYVVLFYKTNRFSGELKSSNEGARALPRIPSILPYPRRYTQPRWVYRSYRLTREYAKF